MTREQAIALKFTHEKIISVTLLDRNGKELCKWEIVQYWKPSNTSRITNPSGCEVDHQVEIGKGFVSGRQINDHTIYITSGEQNNLVVIESELVRIAPKK